MKKGQTWAYILLVFLVIGLGLFVIYSVGSSSISSRVIDSGQESGQAKKTTCRSIQVQYNETEQYIEKEPREVTEYYDYYLKGQKISEDYYHRYDLFGVGNYEEGKVNIKNVDNEGGWFTVTFNWKTVDSTWVGKIRHYIEPDETIEFISKYDVHGTPDVRLTTSFESDSIQKSRIVTKYVDIQKTKITPRYRTETVCG